MGERFQSYSLDLVDVVAGVDGSEDGLIVIVADRAMEPHRSDAPRCLRRHGFFLSVQGGGGGGGGGELSDRAGE